MFILFLPYFVDPLLILIYFFYFILSGKELNRAFASIFRVLEILTIVIFPLLFLGMVDSGDKNDCCNDDVFFSPQHRLTVYAIILFCAIAYFYSSYRKNIATPLIEIIVNCLLLAGIVLNVFITAQSKMNDTGFFLMGTGPIILVFILVLIKNQTILIQHLETLELSPQNMTEKLCWGILRLSPLIKTPIFIILCLPLLVIVTGLLLLFGQKPDSLIRAFTDTYHHGFSLLDHECDNVQCGGHYLCSVAANGHRKIVKPQRLGERCGDTIVCNRQLLVSNAFEELVQEKFPAIHRRIRKAYNHVGNLVHRHYGIFNNKYVADAVYIMMKPLEWLFLLVLYAFDKKPENRIEVQYVNSQDRQDIKNILK
jgi:hypothetical protein